MKNIYRILLLILVGGCSTSTEKSEQSSNLGNLNHGFTISEESRDAFDKGLLLLHSFEYVDAREAFDEAIRKDPNEVMAYWGKTMTYYRALWGLQDVEAGRKVISLLGETETDRMAMIDDELERDFWKGAEILYGEGELYERNDRYAAHMSTLYEKYPGNQEVAAFYSLGLMWSVPVGRNEEVYEKSASIAAGILEENPNHPGALHYMIHAYDDPNFAEKATEAADKYSKVAPDATHALHMPSHIYLALGMWNEMVSSNESSYAASIARLERKGLGDAARGYHSYSWLHYGYLQQGRFEEASELMKDMLEYTKRSPTISARAYLIGMQNAQTTETGEWLEDEIPLFVEYNDLGLTSKAGQHFFRSLAALKKKNSELIVMEIDSLSKHLMKAELIVNDEGIAVCSAGPTRYAPNANDIKRTQSMIQQMHAMAALAIGNKEEAEAHFKNATRLEAETEYSFGPPDIPYPSFEHYGYWLLENKRYVEAIEQFDKSLARAPKRARALLGKKQALEAIGQMDQVTQVDQIMKDFWVGAD